VYIEDVIVHLSSTAAACVGHLNLTFEPVHDLLLAAPEGTVTQTLYGDGVEVLPNGWVRVHVSRDPGVHRGTRALCGTRVMCGSPPARRCTDTGLERVHLAARR
jgi:hypothetical protein